jgi:SAM-dependent methyltransferase
LKLKTIVDYIREGRLRLVLSALRLSVPFYRVVWLAAARRHGLLAHLADRRVPLDELCREMTSDEHGRGPLEAWLQMGVRLGELDERPEGYALRGFLARRLARPEQDAVAAMLEQVAVLHYSVVLETPELLKRGGRRTLDDHDEVLTARFSRVIEPVVREAIDLVLPSSGPIHLLEVGAGSGTYIRYSCRRNPQLTALGLELQPQVARVAGQNMVKWELTERVRVEEGDVRAREPEPDFDIVTLHNSIYYFEVEARVELFRHLRRFLRPGGRLLVTTVCQGGSPVTHAVDIWSASTEGCGRLPRVEELRAQIQEAGLTSVRARSLMPGDSYYAFWAVEEGR